MKVKILGSGAGGGFPQWNCGCRNCRGVRDGTVRATRRGEVCVAVSADGERWILLGCPAEVRGYVEAFPALWPRGERHTPIAGIFLPSGDIDACLGLYTLREKQRLEVWAPDSVRAVVAESGFYRMLQRIPGQVRWTSLRGGGRHEVAGLEVEAVAAPGKAGVENLGFVVRDARAAVAYFPTVAAAGVDLNRADVVLFDGTFWSEAELGPVAASAGSMGHWCVKDSLPMLAALPAREKRLIHVNNTNPLLDEESPERAEVLRRGVRVAFDGEEIAT